MPRALILLVPTCVHASLVPPVMESRAMVIIKHIKLKVREDMFIVISFYASCMYIKTEVLCGWCVLHDLYLLFYFTYIYVFFINFNCSNYVIIVIIRFYQTWLSLLKNPCPCYRGYADVDFQTDFLVNKAWRPINSIFWCIDDGDLFIERVHFNTWPASMQIYSTKESFI